MDASPSRAALLPYFLLPLVLATACSAAAQAPRAVPVTVVVHGLRSDRGHVRVGLYADPNKWTHEQGAVAHCAGEIHDGIAQCVLTAPGAGRYAFAFFHDENDDGKMNKDMLGLPQEGYGFSNDVRPGLGGAPSFQSASFVVSVPSEKAVTARYGL